MILFFKLVLGRRFETVLKSQSVSYARYKQFWFIIESLTNDISFIFHAFNMHMPTVVHFVAIMINYSCYFAWFYFPSTILVKYVPEIKGKKKNKL